MYDIVSVIFLSGWGLYNIYVNIFEKLLGKWKLNLEFISKQPRGAESRHSFYPSSLMIVCLLQNWDPTVKACVLQCVFPVVITCILVKFKHNFAKNQCSNDWKLFLKIILDSYAPIKWEITRSNP